jgi:hypothetical protein
MYIIFPPHLHLLSFTLSLYPSPPTGAKLTRQNLFCCSVLKKKKRHFCLFKILIQGISLWHFHVYMYYNINF